MWAIFAEGETTLYGLIGVVAAGIMTLISSLYSAKMKREKEAAEEKSREYASSLAIIEAAFKTLERTSKTRDTATNDLFNELKSIATEARKELDTLHKAYTEECRQRMEAVVRANLSEQENQHLKREINRLKGGTP